MNMKWRNLPAIVTLLAGFITCVKTTLCRYPLNKMLWVLIAVMTVFFTIGLIIRAVIMHFVEGRDADEADASGDEEDETAAADEGVQNADGSEEGQQSDN